MEPEVASESNHVHAYVLYDRQPCFTVGHFGPTRETYLYAAESDRNLIV